MLGVEIDELLVTENVIARVKKHAGDLMDESLLVGTVDA